MRTAFTLTMVGLAAALMPSEITVAETGNNPVKVGSFGGLAAFIGLKNSSNFDPAANFNSTSAPLAKTSTNDDMDDDNDDLDADDSEPRYVSGLGNADFTRMVADILDLLSMAAVEVRQLQSILLKVNTLLLEQSRGRSRPPFPPNPSAMLLGAYVTALDWIAKDTQTVHGKMRQLETQIVPAFLALRG
ncbi:hypothetical protein BV898_19615 [Hypsibius exemplaris]|uniref:Uncharacterized protein n=1 Tax=Hypsibius exemplaris TaxID=2072580 RepID=A0A9X6NJF2_HYPEX|nr:hypothetical protein BV898_19615 [Hypsibius exemplaris]